MTQHWMNQNCGQIWWTENVTFMHFFMSTSCLKIDFDTVATKHSTTISTLTHTAKIFLSAHGFTQQHPNVQFYLCILISRLLTHNRWKIWMPILILLRLIQMVKLETVENQCCIFKRSEFRIYINKIKKRM